MAKQFAAGKLRHDCGAVERDQIAAFLALCKRPPIEEVHEPGEQFLACSTLADQQNRRPGESRCFNDSAHESFPGLTLSDEGLTNCICHKCVDGAPAF